MSFISNFGHLALFLDIYDNFYWMLDIVSNSRKLSRLWKMLPFYREDVSFFWHVHRVQTDHMDAAEAGFRLWRGQRSLFSVCLCSRAQHSCLEHMLQISYLKTWDVNRGFSTFVSPSSNLFVSNQSLQSSFSASQKLLFT